MTPRKIDATPSWTATAQLLLVLLDNGNDEGKEFARAEILRMGRIIDSLQKVAK